MSRKKKPPHALERRYQRAACEFPAEFSWGTVTHRALVKTIGMGGCFLATEAIIPEGEELDMAIKTDPASEPLQCRGKVAWITERGIRLRGKRCRGFALEFKRIYPEQRARIDEFVKRKNRAFKSIDHELNKARPDKELIKELFKSIYPSESTHLNHIRAVCRDELRYFRLRK